MNPSRVAYIGITSPKTLAINSGGGGTIIKKHWRAIQLRKKLQGFNHPQHKLTG